MKRLLTLSMFVVVAGISASAQHLTPPNSCTPGENLLDTGGQGQFTCDSTNHWTYVPVSTLVYTQINVPNGVAGLDVNGYVSANAIPPSVLASVSAGVTTVSQLPSASSASGQLKWVKDGANAADCTVGNGTSPAYIVPCVSNGTTWAAGAIGTASGAGTVTTFSVAAVPSWLNSSVANAGTTPALTLSAKTGQTTHQVIGTGSGSSFGPVSLAAADIPQLTATQMPAFTGDATSSAGASALTFATVNGAPGACGDATHVCAVTTNGKGLVTAQSAIAISASGSGTVTNTAGSLTSGQIMLGNGGADSKVGNLSGDATTSGSSATTVAKVNGTSVPTNAAADQTIVTTASATGSWASIPSCLDSAGQHLNYNTTTHAYSCGTSGGSAGSAAFNTLTGGTNTQAAMVVGTGGSLAPSGSGTVTANALTGVASSALSDASSLATLTGTQTLTNKTVDGVSPATLAFLDATSSVQTQLNGKQASGSYLTGNQSITLSGDASGSGATSIAVSVAKVNGGAVPVSASVVSTNSSSQLVAASTTGSGSVVLGTSPSLSNPSLGTTAETISVTNAGTTGTTTSKLVKLTGAPSTAVVAATTDTNGVIGIAVSGAGTSGSVQVARAGEVSCVFDGATTAGDYVQISGTTGGDCHDTGAATYPTSGGQVLGRVLSTNVGGGTYAMTVAGAEVQAASSGGSMVYPGAGIPVSTGSAWSTSLSSTAPTFTGAVTAASYATSGTTPGAASLTAGTGSISALPSNSAGFAAPATGGTAYLVKLPATATIGVPFWATPGTADGVNETALSILAPSTAGFVLTSNGPTAAPSFQASAGGSSTPDITTFDYKENFCNANLFSIYGDIGGFLLNNSASHSGGTFGGVDPCYMTFTTGASSLQKSWIAESNVTLTNVNNKTFDTKVRASLSTTSTISAYFGLSNNPQYGGSTIDGLFIRFDTALSDTKFTYYSCFSGTCTTVASTVNADTALHTFRIRSTTAGTILFSIDGGTETSISTNVPTSVVGPVVFGLTNSASAISLTTTYMGGIINGLTR